MVDIISQIASKVPENKLADAVQAMFRITASAGAGTVASNVGKLAKLMQANHNAIGSNVSGQIADEKKNSLQGLWAQVTSTFTEGVVQAMENREGGWAGMLVHLRDYLADPKTIEMISNIIDLVEMLAKTMAFFAKIWAGAYHMFPNLINTWLKVQMLFTQIGYLFTPVVQVLGAVNMFKNAILGLGGALGIASTAANNVIMTSRAAGAANVASGGLAGLYGISPAAALTAGEFAQRHQARFLATEGTMAVLGDWANRKEYAKRMAPVRAKSRIYTDLANGRTARMATIGTRLGWGADAAVITSMARQRVASGSNLPMYQNILNLDAQRRSFLNSAKGKENQAAMLRNAQNARLMELRRPLQQANPELMARYYGRYRWKAMGKQFAAGRAMEALDIASLFTGIKNRFWGLMSGLARAVGLLVSPVGLAVTGIAALAGTLFLAWKNAKAYKDKAKNIANDNDKKGREARKANDNRVLNLAKKYNVNEILPSLPTNYANFNNVLKGGQHSAYIDAIDTNASALEANRKWTSYILSNRNARLAYGNDFSSLGNNLIDNYNNVINQGFVQGIGGSVDFSNMDRRNDIAMSHEAANARTKSALLIEGATNKKTIAAQNKIIELRKQLLAQQITQKEFAKKVQDILNRTANPNAQGLLKASDYGAGQIASVSDWSKFDAFQQGAFNVLNAEIQGAIGSISGRLEAIEKLKNSSKIYTSQWWNAIAHVIDGMQYPLEVAGQTVYTAVKALPNGRIDYSNILFQVRQIAKDFQLNISDFANMAAQVYAELAKLGVVDGKWYSNFGKFTYEQIQHAPVTYQDALNYFDAHYRDKNGSWGIKKKYNREEYAKAVSQNKADDGFGAERTLIRKSNANRAGYAAKKLVDSQQDQAKKLQQQYKNLAGSSTGTNANPSSSSGNKSGNQKDYASSYGRNAARPTQVIINIDNLCRFDRTAINKDADSNDIAMAVENKISEAIALLSASALNSAGAVISQGLS